MRAVALCLLEHQNRVLLQEFWHEHEHYHFYRPPGGGIEFGERAADAIRRELREELDAEVSEPAFVRVMENIFEYGGELKHEIVFLFRATVLDPRVTGVPEVQLIDNTYTFRAVWKPVHELLREEVVLYPVALRSQLAVLYAGQAANATD
ncbi:MAG: NUDIX domain-containing protein [Bacteroidetes bacterium]|nr:MAG: NUDIX domain-containing protein [Bacteroidota bacterium]